MATYSSYKELVENTLRVTDEVRFKVKDALYFYKVFSDHLSCINRAENAGIFTALDISDKNAFAAHIYGYTVCRGTEPTAWPEYCFSDLEAATNIVLALFKLCEDYNKKATDSEPKEGFSCDGFSFTRKDIPESCPYHPYVIDQAITEFSKGIKPTVKSPKDALEECISKSVSTWFLWSSTSQGIKYWKNIYEHPSFVPENYIPTFFLEDIVRKVPEKPQEHCKDLPKESPKITPRKSLKIPCSYEEVVISFKKKPIHF